MRCPSKIKLFTTISCVFFLLNVRGHAQDVQVGADGVNLRSASSGAGYTWMLPKTVIEITLTYTLESCFDPDHAEPGKKPPETAMLHAKITPTLVGRALPDTYVGRRRILTDNLASWWQDQNITLKTFAGSHIMSSIGSAPANQVGQIAGNIFGGIAKLVGAGLIPLKAAEATATGAAIKCGALDTLGKIDGAKKTIRDLQAALASGVDETTQKKDTAQIQALQTLISALQADLTITTKKTIDPGYDQSDNEELYHNPTTPPKAIGAEGKIGSFTPTAKQLDRVNWYRDFNGLPDAQKKALATLFEVNVYLDFSNAYPPISAGPEGYKQTPVAGNNIYRDVTYIPVLIWRGQKLTSIEAEKEDPPQGAVQLNPSQALAFGQFGVAQGLPLSVDAFKSLAWSITFLENGEITDATFSSKAAGVNLSALFGNAASAANTIAAEQRSVISASSRAAAVQGEADLVYQSHRLAVCQATPKECPGK